MTSSLLAPSVVYEPLEGMLGGDVVVTPLVEGRRLEVAFRGAYELILVVDGRVVGRALEREDRKALIFVTRRVPALYAALEETFTLVLREAPQGVFSVTDLYHREESCYIAHGEMLNRITRLDVVAAPFAAVEPPRYETELRRDLQRLEPLGNLIEVRREEDGVVVGRSRFDRVSQGDLDATASRRRVGIRRDRGDISQR